MAVLREDRSLWVVESSGRATMVADSTDGILGFPTWSPDGSRIAAVRTNTAEMAVVVIDAASATLGQDGAGHVVFRSETVGPFYLSWTPDGRSVAFLASDDDGLALWAASADLDLRPSEAGPATLVRRGAPFYFDWIGDDRLMAHVGGGADAFVGEVDLTGAPIGAEFESPGSFRVAGVSADGRLVGFVRGSALTGGEVVIAERDGANVTTMPVFGSAALDFSPTEPILAVIGADVRPITASAVSVGPLRALDARTREVRVLLDGLVASFDWSPDGTMIAAVHVVTVDHAVPVAASGVSLVSAAERREVHLSFIDVATGTILSERAVALGAAYVEAVLPYFDQYALSHRLWAPDSSSFVLPVVGEDGMTQVSVFFPNGEDPISLEGIIGFWSLARDR